jgi:hypothetical protein
LLESKLVRGLDEAGFFVEPNQSIPDERTGKSREIDIVAEYYNPNRPGVASKVCVKTHFVIEAINNAFPFVLTIPRPKSPVTASFEEYLKYASTPKEDADNHPFLGKIDFLELKGVWNWRPFSQWCALTRKKANDELMASHPDDVYSSLLKMAEYTVDAVEAWALSDRSYWRLFFWQPVLVLKDNLMVLTKGAGGRLGLKRVATAKFEFNFHYRERPRTVIIDFVTEANLVGFLLDAARRDELCESQLAQLRSSPPK